jgi:hypothetical protein
LQEDALVGLDGRVVAERRRPFIEREERQEEAGDPFAQQRLAHGEVEAAELVKPRHRLRRRGCPELEGFVPRDRAALGKIVRERVVGIRRGDEDQLSL